MDSEHTTETTPGATPMDTGNETYSKETVEQLKRERAELQTSLAAAAARNQKLEEREREALRAMVPTMKSGTQMLVDNPKYADHRKELQAMHEWTETCADRNDVETTAKLARFVHCASAEIQLASKEAESMKSSSDELKRVHSELDASKSEVELVTKKLRESQELQQEQYKLAQSLQERLHQAGLVKEQHDFSKVTSREAPRPAAESAPSGLVDELQSAFKAAQATASTRITQNRSNDPFIGGASDVGIPLTAYAI